MKPEEYNPKAREAFGKSLIDVGVGIFKGVVLLFTVAPMTLLIKNGLNENNDIDVFIHDIKIFINSKAYWISLCFY